MRYAGQSYELPIPWHPSMTDILTDFHAAYRQAYAYAHPDAPVEIVNLRLHAAGKREPLILPTFPTVSSDPGSARLGDRFVILEGADHQPAASQIPCYRGEDLQPGNQLSGPALIVRSDTTIFLHPGDTAEVDTALNLWVDINTVSY